MIGTDRLAVAHPTASTCVEQGGAQPHLKVLASRSARVAPTATESAHLDIGVRPICSNVPTRLPEVESPTQALRRRVAKKEPKTASNHRLRTVFIRLLARFIAFFGNFEMNLRVPFSVKKG